MEDRFNLIDEPWIPVADAGRVSLRQVFTNPAYRALGGNPVQKIALMKLLLAIAQAACTPKDEAEWRSLGAGGLVNSCLSYLDKWRKSFFLYGEKPFLQMPQIEHLIKEKYGEEISSDKKTNQGKLSSKIQKNKVFGAGFYPDLPSENNTIFFRTLIEKKLSDAEKAVFLVSLMNFSFGGKRVESNITSLAGDLLGNRYSAPAGPSLGGWDGQLHCFPFVDSIVESVWVNMMTEKDIQIANCWPSGVGRPIWECYPEHEKCSTAKDYKMTYQSSLLAFSRFVLLKEDGLFYFDGIQYPKVKDGWLESSILIDKSGEDIKVKYANVEKKAWRELDSIIGFNVLSSTEGFECLALKKGVPRIVEISDRFSIWCGGIKVSSNSGDQSAKQRDDFVESQVWIQSSMLGELWFAQLQTEMTALDDLSKILYGCVVDWFTPEVDVKSKKDIAKSALNFAAQATHTFWQLCERDFQTLVDQCDQGEAHKKQRYSLRLRFAGYVHQAYDSLCPRDTARQLDAWARCRPNLSKYLKQEN